MRERTITCRACKGRVQVEADGRVVRHGPAPGRGSPLLCPGSGVKVLPALPPPRLEPLKQRSRLRTKRTATSR